MYVILIFRVSNCALFLQKQKGFFFWRRDTRTGKRNPSRYFKRKLKPQNSRRHQETSSCSKTTLKAFDVHLAAAKNAALRALGRNRLCHVMIFALKRNSAKELQICKTLCWEKRGSRAREIFLCMFWEESHFSWLENSGCRIAEISCMLSNCCITLNSTDNTVSIWVMFFPIQNHCAYIFFPVVDQRVSPVMQDWAAPKTQALAPPGTFEFAANIPRNQKDPKKNVLQWGVTRTNSPKC